MPYTRPDSECCAITVSFHGQQAGYTSDTLILQTRWNGNESAKSSTTIRRGKRATRRC